MNLCTTIAINNAIVAANAATAAAVCAREPEDKDEEVSPLFGLLAVFLVFVVLPAIIFGIIYLICEFT